MSDLRLMFPLPGDEKPGLDPIIRPADLTRLDTQYDQPMCPDDPDTQRKAFLAVYRKTMRVSEGCRAAGVTRTTFEAWKDTDPEFLVDYVSAQKDTVEAIEAEALRRATIGKGRRKYYKGEQVMMIDPSGAMETKVGRRLARNGEEVVTDAKGELIWEDFEYEVPKKIPDIDYEPSDALLAMLLRANAPDKYGNDPTPDGLLLPKAYMRFDPEKEIGTEPSAEAL